MFDLLIRNGRVVDGTGAPAAVVDIAVSDGVIVAIGESIEGDATRTIDATGKLVTPGFVDCHTHYDGQVTCCLLYTSPSPRDATLSRMPSSA